MQGFQGKSRFLSAFFLRVFAFSLTALQNCATIYNERVLTRLFVVQKSEKRMKI